MNPLIQLLTLSMSPQDWFEWIHVTGFWYLDNPEDATNHAWTPPQALVDFISDARSRGRKIVYIGWGSIVASNAAELDECVAKAVEDSGVSAVLGRGWSARLPASSNLASSGSSNIYTIDAVPHDWLFPRIDAACHHGGAGTLGASLRAGLPTVVKPYFGDQFFWGQQVETLGVGTCVKHCTAENLAAALRKATQDAKQIERARQLGERIRAETGVQTAIDAIYRELPYARTLIKKNTRLTISLASVSLPSSSRAEQELQPRPSRDERPAMSSRSSSADSNWEVLSV